MSTSSQAGHRVSRAAAIAVIGLGFAACVNPNAIGVQDTGTIAGRLIDANSQQPIANAIVSVNSVLNQRTNAGGVFTITNVPIGVQSLTIYANGYQTQTVPNISVVKNQTSQVGLISLQPST